MNPRSPLIALATDSAVPSGVGEHMLALANALKPTHNVALCFVPNEGGTRFLSRSRDAGFETVPINALFDRWLAFRRPTVLHVHAGIGWEGLELVEAGWRERIAVVRTEHLPYVITDPQQKAHHRSAVALTECHIAVSEAAAESFRAQGFPQIVSICNGIETPVAHRSRAEIRAALSISDQTNVVLTVARFTPQKDHACLLRAVAEVSQRLPDTLFLLVGEGEELKASQALARALDLRNVRFLGERADVPDLITAADLFVLPSLFEGLPIAVLEAMALALPVVATRIGGTVEALGGDHPFLVPSGDPSVLASAIVDALNDSIGRRDAGIRGRRRFEQRFVAARMGQQTAAHYSAIREKAGAA